MGGGPLEANAALAGCLGCFIRGRLFPLIPAYKECSQGTFTVAEHTAARGIWKGLRNLLEPLEIWRGQL